MAKLMATNHKQLEVDDLPLEVEYANGQQDHDRRVAGKWQLAAAVGAAERVNHPGPALSWRSQARVESPTPASLR